MPTIIKHKHEHTPMCSCQWRHGEACSQTLLQSKGERFNLVRSIFGACMNAPIHATMPPNRTIRCNCRTLKSLIEGIRITVSPSNLPITLSIIGASFLAGLLICHRDAQFMDASSSRSAAMRRLRACLSMTWNELSVCCHRFSHLLKLAIESEPGRETGLVIEKTPISPPETHSLLSDSIKSHRWSPIEKSIERRRQLRLSRKHTNQENHTMTHASSVPAQKSKRPWMEGRAPTQHQHDGFKENELDFHVW